MKPITRSDDERLGFSDASHGYEGVLHEALKAVIAERDKLKDGHCKDCCCARSWEALGIYELTNMSIPEHIAALRADLAAALAQLADEKQKVANLEEYMLKGVAFRDDLQARLAEKGGQVCRARKLLKNVEKAINDSIRLEQPSFDMPPEPATQRDHEAGMICAMIQDELALASSTPCAHAKEAERLREELGLARTYGCPCCSDLREAGEGALASINERIRQKRAEGWTADHDAKHEDQELAVVAACYAANGTYAPAIDWPETWASEWDKRKKHNREKQLAIAAALCMAEIDRLAELRRRMVYHK